MADIFWISLWELGPYTLIYNVLSPASTDKNIGGLGSPGRGGAQGGSAQAHTEGATTTNARLRKTKQVIILLNTVSGSFRFLPLERSISFDHPCYGQRIYETINDKSRDKTGYSLLFRKSEN